MGTLKKEFENKLTDDETKKLLEITDKAREGVTFEVDSIIIEGIPRDIGKANIVDYIYNVLEAIGVEDVQDNKSQEDYKKYINTQYDKGDLELNARPYTYTTYILTPEHHITGISERYINETQDDIDKRPDSNKYSYIKHLQYMQMDKGKRQVHGVETHKQKQHGYTIS